MKHTILAVDDEPANVRMLERLFHKDFRVLTAASGEEALEILNRETVTLIITDQRMPGMSGTDLLRESLRSRPETIKIILTGYTDIEALIEAINVTRVHKFVSKPWDPMSLKKLVQDAIEDHERQLEQKKLLDGLISLIQSHPGIFIEEAVISDELLADPLIEK
ncbi:MAG: hypothetical protein DMF61_02530 [Blastocatellia bacterium AA13]|nr:MAG: hypothetical protein DMF61_02530 [Blastocatellia bacterium AA13]